MANGKKPKNFNDDDFKPQGTMLVLGIFMVTIIALWGYVYWLLVSRGMTI